MLEVALAHGGGADDEGAVGDGLGYGGEFGGGVQDGGGVDGGAGGFEWDGVFIDDAEVGEAEVVHRAGDGADVLWVAGADEDDGDAVESFGEHECSL